MWFTESYFIISLSSYDILIFIEFLFFAFLALFNLNFFLNYMKCKYLIGCTKWGVYNPSCYGDGVITNRNTDLVLFCTPTLFIAENNED